MGERVYLLGAGFSKAISPFMPTTVELSGHVVRYVTARGRLGYIPGADTPLVKDFEQWLSYLVEAPPWLSPIDQAHNQGAFMELSNAVYEVLTALQMRAVEEGDCPVWLQRLVKYWHDNHATVITFNYDILVELAWAMYSQANNLGFWSLYPVPLTSIAARTGAVLGNPRQGNGLRLLKLHGSLSWRYSGPGSPPGDTLYNLGIKGNAWSAEGASSPYDNAEELASDRVPMIVPPTAIKSVYYGNRTLQELWHMAAERISKAEELVIMGFSLPQTDLLLSSLLATEFKLDDSSIITPVNYSSEIASRIAGVFDIPKNDPRIVTDYTNLQDDALPRWVSTFVG